MYDYDAKVDRATAESIVEVSSRSARSESEALLVARLGNPVFARYFAPHRQSDSYRSRFDPKSAFELLQRFVLLRFENAEAAKAALLRLREDPNVLSVSPNGRVSFSVAPADPLYSQTVHEMDHQWGLHALSMQYAWDLMRGHAYIGHVDSGIETLHPDLQWAYRPQFTWDAGGTASVEEDSFVPNGTTDAYRGHGTHTAGIIAATTSDPLISTGYPNPPIQGGAGVCWYCSLMVLKATDSNGRLFTDGYGFTTGIYLAAVSGAQVINMSFGFPPGHPDIPDCGATPLNIWCLVLTWAQARDVLLIAAAGNSMVTTLDFPASDNRTIAVGASQFNSGARGFLWTEQNPQTGFVGSSTGAAMTSHGVVAPGRDILSTAYSNFDWNPFSRCGDLFPGSSAGVGYGVCTGTSMSTAFVTGIAGLMRSANPLRTAGDIRTRLLYTSSNAPSAPNADWGWGIPNAYLAVYWSFFSPANKLTPLFSFWGPETVNYYYTTVPQMAVAAVEGTLPPAPNNDWSHNYYTPVGNTISEYPAFPSDTSATPRAQAWVFTSHANPHNPGQPLRPLYRLSFKCGDPLPPGVTSVCDSFPHHVDHFYSTDYSEVQYYIANAGYKLDGIEGYVYPPTSPFADPPPNTERLYRAYKASIDDHAIFPESELYQMTIVEGYAGQVLLGHVYRNLGSRPTY